MDGRLARNPFKGALSDAVHAGVVQCRLFEKLWHPRRWVTDLVIWYNNDHRHSSLGFVTPAQRHAGLDRGLNKRAQVYAHARQENPQRRSKQNQDWRFVDTVHLNPDKPHSKELENIRKKSLGSRKLQKYQSFTFVIASVARQSMAALSGRWIATACGLAMTKVFW